MGACTIVHRGTYMLRAVGSTKKPLDFLARNLRVLMKKNKMKAPELSERSGVSVRMIKYILSQERTPTIEVAELLANALKIKGWQLMMPDLDIDLAMSGRLDALLDRYMKSTENGREYIDRVAERESTYRADK